MMKMGKNERTRVMRWKRPALASMGWEWIDREIDEISEACDNVRWFIDEEGGDEKIINALDGDEDEAFEFKMAFSDLSAKCEMLHTAISEAAIDTEQYDDCTVAIVGNRYSVVGYDGEEEDYYSLTSYEQDLALTEAGKRLMRLTKADMLSTIGQCVGTMMAFYDLRHAYDYLKATMDIIRDTNTSLLDTIRQIDEAYNEAAKNGFRATGTFDSLVSALPDRSWIE